MRIGIQTFGPAFSTAALPIDNLLDAIAELRLPSVRRKVVVLAIEDVVDGVGTVRHDVSRVQAECGDEL
jgi:hypothetical protein